MPWRLYASTASPHGSSGCHERFSHQGVPNTAQGQDGCALRRYGCRYSTRRGRAESWGSAVGCRARARIQRHERCAACPLRPSRATAGFLLLTVNLLDQTQKWPCARPPATIWPIPIFLNWLSGTAKNFHEFPRISTPQSLSPTYTNATSSQKERRTR